MKFKIGDRVIFKSVGLWGTVKGVDTEHGDRVFVEIDGLVTWWYSAELFEPEANQ